MHDLLRNLLMIGLWFHLPWSLQSYGRNCDGKSLGIRPVHGNYSWSNQGSIDWVKRENNWLAYPKGESHLPNKLLCDDRADDCSSVLVELCDSGDGSLCQCRRPNIWNGIPDFNKKIVFLTIGDSNHRGFPTGYQISASFITFMNLRGLFASSYFYPHATDSARINPNFSNSCTSQMKAIPCGQADWHHVITVGCGGNDLAFEGEPTVPEVTGGINGWEGRWRTFQNELIGKFQDRSCYPGGVTLVMMDQPDPADGGQGSFASEAWLGLERLYGIYSFYEGVFADNLHVLFIKTQESFTGHYGYCHSGWCYHFAANYCGIEGCASDLPGGAHLKLTLDDGIHQTPLGHQRAALLLIKKLRLSWGLE